MIVRASEDVQRGQSPDSHRTLSADEPVHISTATPLPRFPVLDVGTLNRAHLERQMLLRRSAATPLDAVSRLVGLQAQAPNPPYVGLWTRLTNFRAADLGQLLIDRQVVRVALMRSTIHLVTADDCLTLRPLIQPALDREVTSGLHGRNLAGLDIDEVVAVARKLLEERPLTGTQLGELLAKRWPDRSPRSLAQLTRNRIPLVHLPPRGVWGKSGPPTMTTAEHWLGRPLDPAPSIDALILRYLAAFGPATIQDIQTWSGLTRLRAPIEQMRRELEVFQDEDGVELFDFPNAPRPDPETPAPPRFLAEFDNALLSHANRRRIIGDEHRKRMATSNGMIPGAVLVDGFLRGTWRITRGRGVATLVIQPYERIRKPDQVSLADEGALLLDFGASGFKHEVAFASLA